MAVERRVNYKGAQGNFWEIGTTVYLDCGFGYSIVFIKEIFVKGVNFAVCKLYFHFKKLFFVSTALPLSAPQLGLT